VEHARHVEIVGVARPAGNLGDGIDSGNVFAYGHFVKSSIR
jgi:hypothetical protein